jgi:hypothetical protein
MKQTAQSTNAHPQSQLRFVLVNGLLKKGGLFFVCWFFGGYLFHFKTADFLDLIQMSVLGGAIFGLSIGLIDWHRSKGNSMKK